MSDQLNKPFRFPLGEPPAQDVICKFLASPYYILIVMLLTAMSNLFGWELFTYSLFILVAVYCCIWGKDLLPVAPLVFSSYIAPSTENNPGRNPDSLFFPENGGNFLLLLVALLIAALIWHISQHKKRFFSRKPRLLSGMFALAGAYLLSGTGTDAFPQYLGSNMLFALLQGIAIIVPYWVLWNGINWKQAPRDYFCWIGFGTGFVLVIEILGVFFASDVIANGIIDRTKIYTGWGMYNNMGAMLAMMVPFPFYMSTKYGKSWIGIVSGSVFLIAVLLTCSRTSIVTGVCMFIACFFIMKRNMPELKIDKKVIIIILSSFLLALLIFCVPLLRLFSKLLELGVDPSNRDILFRDGLDLFQDYPLFGGSFFSPEKKAWSWSTVESFSAFFPPRWHNTFVQVLASSGLVGLVTYLFHRTQTLKLFLSKRSPEHTAIGISILTLLICSQFDCHFFNIGPVLFYSMALAFAERLRREQ